MPLCPILSNPSGGEGRGTASQNSPPPLPSFGVSQLNFGAANGRAELRGVRAGAASWGLRFFGGGEIINLRAIWSFGGRRGAAGPQAVPPANRGVRRGEKSFVSGKSGTFGGPSTPARTRRCVGDRQHRFLQGESDGTRRLAWLRDTESLGDHGEAPRPLGFPGTGKTVTVSPPPQQTPTCFLIFSSFISSFL